MSSFAFKSARNKHPVLICRQQNDDDEDYTTERPEFTETGSPLAL